MDVRQAVLEFDAAVQVPWRPLLGSGDARCAPARAVGAPGPARSPAGSVLPGSGPRVAGHLRPVPDRPGVPGPRAAVTAPARGAGRSPAVGSVPPGPHRVRPGGRAVTSGVGSAGAVRGGCVPSGGARLRLTGRGRALVRALVLSGAVAFGAWVAPVVGGHPGGELRLAGGDSVVVGEGDTVWSIAGELAGGTGDVRAVVDAIEELNDLEGSVVVPGQVLAVP
ncbi:LysM peptidoglycan-binding domain-containing protein [Geodermatophilus sp. DSM 44513]|uniref:LysM peptidoglycan-binding domain-containing protein n=1 Tax=Geodermatophilus sp. DSM 44513 TaxID=1528104 RepID=UPI001412D752|nr:LysM peptidoglycan-binding domain-containing protein [Geodermatophilus sp. DSM 44513]WNV74356.1 LysM peptidoglycan-binding domain-containing protein [Geodermatophilus sp. DSM 44513]